MPVVQPSGEELVAATQRAERVRAAIVLCYYQELSQSDAAAMLGVSPGALESLLSRGRAALKKHMQSELH